MRRSLRNSIGVVWLSIPLLASVGCQKKQDEIRTYRVAPPSDSMAASKPAGPVAPEMPAPKRASFESVAPEGWAALPTSRMRQASYKTEAGSEVTAFVFPAAPAMADPLANVNRWRREIGLEPTSAEELEKELQTLRLAGEEARLIELTATEEKTVAAMQSRDGQVWFFKIRGPVEAVDGDAESFRQWLGTIKF